MLLLLCDLIHRSTAKQQAAEQAACVTPANLQQQLQNGEGRHSPPHHAWLLGLHSNNAVE